MPRCQVVSLYLFAMRGAVFAGQAKGWPGRSGNAQSSRCIPSGGAMKIEFYCCRTVPWEECELCFIGPAVLNEGDGIRLSLGLFFIEVGIKLKKGERNESDS